MKTIKLLKTTLWVACAFVWAGPAAAQTGAVLIYDDTKPAIRFAAGDLKAALELKKQFTVSTAPPAQIGLQTAPVQVIVTTNGAIAGQPAVAGLSKEGFAIRRITTAGNATQWWVIGNDVSGAMYAALEVADSVKIDGHLNNVTTRQLSRPSLEVRGFKFNIPLDERARSYADGSTAAQANTPEMWSRPYWERFLDQMARSRMNTLSLWNNNPFLMMVKLPSFPNLPSADVVRDTDYLYGAANQGKTETIRKMTIDEKIQHWQYVMQYANDRGVAVSIFTWNIEPEGAKNFGVTESVSDARTKLYYREGVRALFNTYPLLSAIGVTAGENFPTDDKNARMRWVAETYGQGFNDAVRDAKDPASPYYRPDRKLRFIQRAHEVDNAVISGNLASLSGYGDEDSSLSLTYKYSQAHMHSSVRPKYIDNWLSKTAPGKKVALEVRNDDFFNLRWGDPDFARAYLGNFPDRSKVNGFLMGPDGYTWGREVISKNPDNPRQQIIDKFWYMFAIWGHLAYDADVPNSRFQSLLEQRYPELPPGNLYTGLAQVSRIWPLINRFYWGSLDFQWYPEGSWSQDKGGYQGVQAFLDGTYRPMGYDNKDGDPITLMSVKDFVNGVAPNGRWTPLQVADKLSEYADAGARNVSALNAGANKDLKETLVDVRAVAALGLHYAEKIRGAVAMGQYNKTNDKALYERARAHLTRAADHWKEYSALYASQYSVQRVSRAQMVIDLEKTGPGSIQARVESDIPGGRGGAIDPPPVGNAHDITSLVLVNASNGAAIRTLQANETLSLGKLGAPSVSIQAIANAGAKSVKFVSAAAGVSRTEGSAPWAFLGNSGNTYTPWKPTAQTYSITATGYSASGATGTAGKPMTVTIKVTP